LRQISCPPLSVSECLISLRLPAESSHHAIQPSWPEWLSSLTAHPTPCIVFCSQVPVSFSSRLPSDPRLWSPEPVLRCHVLGPNLINTKTLHLEARMPPFVQVSDDVPNAARDTRLSPVQSGDDMLLRHYWSSVLTPSQLVFSSRFSDWVSILTWTC
jgi:hypothetical protein